jgi:ribosomal-protein-alanine N-acetyltransferase
LIYLVREIDIAEPNIRVANPNDLPRVLEIERSSFDTPYTPDYLEMLLRFEQGVFLVAEIGSSIVGYVVATVRGSHGHIISIAVEPKRRRMGIGSKLMKCAIEELRRRGASIVRLEVKKGSPAVNFYLSAGFRQSGILHSYYDDGSDALSMERSL